ncbi:MAG: hypothetical protein PHR77_16125 [Kiritimatiellae bacterium]|nr:hypothetical protein [Kiritimatiellia bacterium]MDD5523408.1 hypothetical protein [Kiritimatiellia bacterium]
MIAAVVAGLIVLAQWFVVQAGDDFTLVQHDGNQYKVFSYGFPFKIVSCNEVLELATPQRQIHWRQVGNWGTFFLIGLLTIETIRKFRTSFCSVRGNPRR